MVSKHRHTDAYELGKRKDEYDLDFEDTKAFAVERYKDILATIDDELFSQVDRNLIREEWDWQSVQAEIQKKRLDGTMDYSSRKLINEFQPLPKTLQELSGYFRLAVEPYDPPMERLWGLLFLNLKLACESSEKLKKTAEWISQLRRGVHTFNRCIDTSKDDDMNETRIAIVDGLSPLLIALVDSVKFLRTSSSDSELKSAWPAFNAKIKTHLSDLNGTARHLNDLINLSQASRIKTQRDLMIRHTALPDSDEPASFPIKMVQYQRNPRFFGRQAELDKIDKSLDWTNPNNTPLRMYTIYGRRGVGKTELALQYAYENPTKFDAIFWVACETALGLRQSFTNIAIAAKLPGAERHGHDEENQLAVLQWLKKTRCRWLMIFDNAEKENLLKGYWPVGANGAILITSRQYVNFMQHRDRKGDTIKPFNPEERFELLFRLLGEDWNDMRKQGKLPQSEIKAAQEFLAELQGLGLAIMQASILIKNERIGGPAIETTYQVFKEHQKNLPPRHLGKRSETYLALDALWDMNFKYLSINARNLLSVLALLSPDSTYIELFLPRKQSILDGKLAFCKQKRNLVDNQENTLTTVLAPSPELETALDGLLRAELIKRDGRIINVHRVVQEAVNYTNEEDLQESFDAAVRLVAEAFPKRQFGSSLFQAWPRCALYIHDGVHLVLKFAEYSSTKKALSALRGTDELVQMIGNLSWYLYEMSDYDGAIQIIEIGQQACEDKQSLQYADLCNTAGVCYTEKNFLPKCRQALEECLLIREAKLDPNDIEIAAITHNIGNLETAIGNYDKALEYFNRAVNIRLAQGETAENQLALLYLCIGRVYTEQEDYDAAQKMYSQAQSLFVRTIGADKHYMAHVHYAFGNLEFRTSNWGGARQSYNSALRIALQEVPIHPITAAAYLSLGQVEFKSRNIDLAKSHIEKARQIAELRSPTRDDGTVARILYVLQNIMRENILTAGDAEEMKTRAEVARNALVGAGESAPVDTYDQEGNIQPAVEAKLYDALVPIFFR